MMSPNGGEGGLAKRWHWMTWGEGGAEGPNIGWHYVWTARYNWFHWPPLSGPFLWFPISHIFPLAGCSLFLPLSLLGYYPCLLTSSPSPLALLLFFPFFSALPFTWQLFFHCPVSWQLSAHCSFSQQIFSNFLPSNIFFLLFSLFRHPHFTL